VLRPAVPAARRQSHRCVVVLETTRTERSCRPAQAERTNSRAPALQPASQSREDPQQTIRPGPCRLASLRVPGRCPDVWSQR
jgi:hypothetical protein